MGSTMRMVVVVAALALGCTGSKNDPVRGVDTSVGGDSTGGDGAVGPGYLEVEGGARCTVDDGELVGFCGDAPTSFWADGSTELAEASCAEALSATVWFSSESWEAGGSHELVADNETLESGSAAVWFDRGGETWVSSGGTAAATRVGADAVRVDFETTATVDFLTREEPGPGVRGQVWCTLADG